MVRGEWQAKRGKAVWEHQNGMMCWTVCTNRGCLWVNLCMCVHMCLTVFWFFGFFFLSLCMRMHVCVREGEAETVTTHRCTQIVTQLHILMTSSFYWTINRWRLGGNMLPRLWSLTDQTSAPSISPGPGCMGPPPHGSLWCCLSGPVISVRQPVVW